MNRNIQVTIQVINDNFMNQNTYIVINEKNEAIIIDPGYSKNTIKNFIRNNSLKPVAILLTHYHFDHVSSTDDLCDQYGISAYIHPNDYSFLLKDTLAVACGMPEDVKVNPQHIRELTNGRVELFGFVFDVINLKGHSNGSSFFIFGQFVFTGDVLFLDSTGRTDLPGSNPFEQLNSLKWIKENINLDQIIYPGHGPHAFFDDVLAKNKFLK